MATQVTLGSGVIDSASGLKLRSNGSTEAVDISTAQVVTLAKDAVISGLTVGKGAGAVSTNVAVGDSAISATATGTNNTAVGSSALSVVSSGSNNTAVGRVALANNTTGGSNTGIGRYALSLNTTGNYNTAVGQDSLASNTTGSQSTAIGYQAANSHNSTATVDAFGYQALYSNTSGDNNVAFGINSLRLNTTGSANSALGRAALNANTTGSYNTALGRSALESNTTASNNTAVGYQAGYTNATGANNTFFGYQAGYSSAVSSASAGNTFVGLQAGYSVTTGTRNTFIGPDLGCGYYITTGSKNTIIGGYDGNRSGLDIRTASNYIVLSDGDGNPRMYMNGSTFWSPATVNYTTGGSANVRIFASGDFGTSTSSLRYKRNIENAPYGLADVMNLRPVIYQSKAKQDGEQVFGGFIAEEVHEAGLTQFVDYDDEGRPNALQYGNMVSLMAKAIQELKSELDSVKAELATLKGA